MKKNKILNIIALFLASILICLGSYRIYEYMFLDDDIDINENENDNDNDNDVNNKLEELDINSDLVKSLISPFYNNLIFSKYTNMNLLNENFDNKNASNKQLLSIAFSYMKSDFNESIINFEDVYENGVPSGRKYSISKSDFKEYYYEKIFGPELDFIPISIGYNMFGCNYLNYDYENSKDKIEYDIKSDTFNWFEGNGGCGAYTFTLHNVGDLYRAVKINDEIYLYYYVFELYEDSLSNSCSIYNIHTEEKKGELQSTRCKENEILENVQNEIEILKKLNELSIYKATFKKQSDGNYYFAKGDWLEINKVDDNNTENQLDLTKSLNTNNITYHNPRGNDYRLGISVKLNDDNKSATLSIDWGLFCNYGYENICSNGIEDFQIVGFSKKIKSIFIGGMGQTNLGMTLFYLMEDGTVEYTQILKQKDESYVMNYDDTNKKFLTQGNLKDVKNVVKFYLVDASAGNGWETTIGALADGSFYDLGSIIMK